ncbi:MAG: hypothetical protein K5751_11200 [Treponemataceae bacterium]|nr:hypothetical protein [Treponemataceae bacterium]
MPWKMILFVIVIVLVAVFVGANHANACNISFIFTEFQNVPVYFTILFSFVVGMLVMLPFTIGKKRGKAPRQMKDVDDTEVSTREEFPAESARNRRNRRRQEAAARKAERAAKKNGKNVAAQPEPALAVVPVSEIPNDAETPAIQDVAKLPEETK